MLRICAGADELSMNMVERLPNLVIVKGSNNSFVKPWQDLNTSFRNSTHSIKGVKGSQPQKLT